MSTKVAPANTGGIVHLETAGSKTKIALCLLALLVCALPITAQEKADLPALRKLAQASEAEGAYPEALDYLRQIAALSTEDEPARLEARKAMCALIQRHPEALPLGEPLLRVGGDLQAPKRYYSPDPIFPDKALARRDSVLILQAVIDREGCLHDVKVLKGRGTDVDAAAKAAVEEWIFEPAQLQGKKVDIYFDITIRFLVDRGAEKG